MSITASRSLSDAPAVAPGTPLMPPGSFSPSPPSALPYGQDQAVPDLSAWSMFLHADPIVQAVMLLLVAAVVLTWTIGLAKAVELHLAIDRGKRLLHLLLQMPSLNAAFFAMEQVKGPERAFVGDVVNEISRSYDHTAGGRRLDEQPRLMERIASLLERLETAAARRMGIGMGFLATVGATSPFIGLFGTVWGIMDSFIGISKAQTTNLAVVAPGIAEALLATALGLVAAIPAVILYNVFSRRISFYRTVLRDISSALLRLTSRDLDRNVLDQPGNAPGRERG